MLCRGSYDKSSWLGNGGRDKSGPYDSGNELSGGRDKSGPYISGNELPSGRDTQRAHGKSGPYLLAR